MGQRARTTRRCCGPLLMVGKEGWKMVPLEQAEPAVIAAGCLGNSRYMYSQTLTSLSLLQMQIQIKLLSL